MVSILSNAKTPYHLASKPWMTLNVEGNTASAEYVF